MSRGAAVALVALLAATTGANAQTVPDSNVPATAGLDLPGNFTVFGKRDPNVRKPTAIVNNTVITETDVDQRVALIIAINNYKVSGDDMERLRLQVLRMLIDETLQIQEAKANDITVAPAELEASFAGVAKRFGKTPDEMRKWLRDIGSSERSIKRQIEGELAWGRLLRRNVQVNVGDAEVNAILDRMKAAKGTEEYHVMEIYLNATPDRADQVYAAEQQMIEQMKQGAPFQYFARTYSEASTRATGGDLGWIRGGMLPEPLDRAVRGLEVGQVAGPIEVPGGFSIVFLADKRQVLTADPRDAKLSLRQISIQFPAGTTQAQATQRAAEFERVTREMQGCGDVSRTASVLGAQIVDNDSIRVRDVPPALQAMLLPLQVGEATKPFGSLEDGIRVLVLCGRDDPIEASLPSPEQVQEQLEEERVNLRAERMLRDLRRDALIEYR
ncbi:MAG: peptidylprolyl isomerase [Pseudomonadota bacterium]